MPTDPPHSAAAGRPGRVVRTLLPALLLATTASPARPARPGATDTAPAGVVHRPVAGPVQPDGWRRATSTEGRFSIGFPAGFSDISYDGIRSEPGEPLHVNDIHKLQGTTTDDTRLTAMCIVNRIGRPAPSRDVLNAVVAGCRAHETGGAAHPKAGALGLVRGVEYDKGSCLLFIEFATVEAATGLDALKARFFGSFTPPPKWHCRTPG